MAQDSKFWDGHAVGDAPAGKYDDQDLADADRWKFTSDNPDQGVINQIGSELNVADHGDGHSVDIISGAALVNGRLYYNDGTVNIAINGVSVWWIVGLFSDESAQTIRAFARGNYANEAAALASLTQTPGDDWEIPLATLVTDGTQHIDTIYDQRIWAFRSPYQDFVPAVAGYDYTGVVAIEREYLGVPLADSALCGGFGQFRVPHRHYSSMIIVPVIISLASGDAYMQTAADYGQLGVDDYNETTNIVTYTAETVTTPHIEMIHGPTLTNIQEGGGDFICISTFRDATDPLDTIGNTVYLCGWQMYYEVLF